MADHDYGKRTALCSHRGEPHVRDAPYFQGPNDLAKFDFSKNRGRAPVSNDARVKAVIAAQHLAGFKATIKRARIDDSALRCGCARFHRLAREWYTETGTTPHERLWRGTANKEKHPVTGRLTNPEKVISTEAHKELERRAQQVYDAAMLRAAPEQPRDNPERTPHQLLMAEYRARALRLGLPWTKGVGT
jgi:hypothetical protein